MWRANLQHGSNGMQMRLPFNRGFGGKFRSGTRPGGVRALRGLRTAAGGGVGGVRYSPGQSCIRRWVKAFRQVQGIKAKTDAIDARLLQGFGRNRLNAGMLRLGRVQDMVLDALMARRRQLTAALHAEQCRRETAAVEPVRASIERMIAQLETELGAIEAELSTHEDNDPRLAFKEAVLCTHKGVAQASAVSAR